MIGKRDSRVISTMSATIVTSSSHISPGQGTINRTSSPDQGATGSSNMESVSGFVNKPARGWLHPDHLFAKDGINYNVRVSDKGTLFDYFKFYVVVDVYKHQNSQQLINFLILL